jgi:hypothetical protein
VLRAIGVLLVLGLTLYALIDCIRTDEHAVKGLPKMLWVLVIVLVSPIGPIAWLVAGRDRNRPGPVVGRGPVAPDDDPEFLRSLERERRRKAEEELRRKERQDRKEQGLDGDGPAPRGDGA